MKHVKLLVLPLISASFLLGTTDLNAEPEIGGVSGDLSHGETVIVTGQDFGNRGDFNNVDARWRDNRFIAFRVKDFDDGELGGNGFSNPNSSWLLSTGGRSDAGYFATKFYNGQRLGALSATQEGTTGEWYLSFWYMNPPGTADSKFFRLYGDRDSGANNVWLNNREFFLHGSTECTAPECSKDVVWSSPDRIVGGRWHRVEIYLSQSNNGTVSTFLDGNHQWTRPNWMAEARGAYDGHTIDLGNMINAAADSENSPASNSFNFDDVYFDFTLARVEIGNAPRWDECTHREVQVPLAWSPNSISIAVNQGSFEPGTGLYLFVVNADGRVNEIGYPIVISGGRVPVAPEVGVD